MPTLVTDIPRFDERDLLIVQHVARHHLTTNEALRRLFFPASQPNSVVKVTSRLCRQQMLQKFPLIHPQVYFTLTAKACRQIGRAPSRSQPLGPQPAALDTTKDLQTTNCVSNSLGFRQPRITTSTALTGLTLHFQCWSGFAQISADRVIMWSAKLYADWNAGWSRLGFQSHSSKTTFALFF